MQSCHISPDRIIQFDAATLAQLHDAGSGEALGVRGNAKAMAWCQRLILAQVSGAERLLQDYLVTMRDGDDATGLFGEPHLECKPLWNVLQGGRQPLIHSTFPDRR